MDRPACLEDMPLEMLAAITEHLGDAALRSLRQASRTIAVGVDLPFMDRFFTNRVHLYTHSSLDALVKITSRAHFARHIKQVTIVIMELDDECNDDPGLHEHPTLKAIATRKQRACGPRNIKAASSKINVRLAKQGNAYGLKELRRQLSPVEARLPGAPGDRAIPALLVALGKSQLQLETFDVGLIEPRNDCTYPYITGSWVPRAIPTSALISFGSLKTLQMEFSLCGNNDSSSRQRRHLHNLLAACQSLESLSISTAIEMHHHIHDDEYTLPAFHVPSLRKLELKNVGVKCATLIEILSAHRTHLQSLFLDRVVGLEGEKWRSVLEILLAECSLQRLYLSSLGTGSTGVCCYGDTCVSYNDEDLCCDWEDAVMTSEGLKDLTRSCCLRPWFGVWPTGKSKEDCGLW